MVYPIGTPLKAWGAEERSQWFTAKDVKQRTYKEHVLTPLMAFKDTTPHFVVEQYGALSHDAERYPLFVAKPKAWDADKKTILITGGVHGYETSGVQGALLFLRTKAHTYLDTYNVVVAPCISPWGYEVINRWNPSAMDPNRNFKANSGAEECAFAWKMVDALPCGKDVFCHFDLHETTDTDESEFRPALAARDGTEYIPGIIPDGYYCVGDSTLPNQAPFLKAIIDAVRKVTHIAPPDDKNELIGCPITDEGVIAIDCKSIFLCAGLTNAQYVTTTEVYPDSAKCTDEECNNAQVAAIEGGLTFLNSLK